MANGKDSSKKTEAVVDSTIKGGSKGTATPRRKDQEAANKRPLVPTDRKVAKQEARMAANAARERARVGLATGDERYLPKRDRGIQRRYVRDFVDARYSFGELLVPFMVLIILWSFIDAQGIYSVYAMWAFVALVFLDSMFLIIALRKRLETKFGKGEVERGVRWYAVMRAIQLRPMRMPKPQVGRRQYPN